MKLGPNDINGNFSININGGKFYPVRLIYEINVKDQGPNFLYSSEMNNTGLK